MRFFSSVCLVCITVASVGCMTNNWSAPLFNKPIVSNDDKADRPDFFHQPFGTSSGLDSRAKEIERNLGVGY